MLTGLTHGSLLRLVAAFVVGQSILLVRVPRAGSRMCVARAMQSIKPSETCARIGLRAVPPPVLSSFRSILSSLAAALHDPLHQDGRRRAKAVHLLVAQPLKEAAARDPNTAFVGGVPDASIELLT